MAWVDVSHAQLTIRPSDEVQIVPKVGLAGYKGDLRNDFLPGRSNLSFGLDIGYDFSNGFGVILGGTYANYPAIGSLGTVRFLVRRTFGFSTARLAPYIQLGGHASGGDDPAGAFALAAGPALGAGFDLALADGKSFFVEVNSDLAFPDDALDARAGDDDFGFDFLNTFRVGFRVTLKRTFLPVNVFEITCTPQEVTTGQPVDFFADVNPEATKPITYRWDFGDGNTASNPETTHAYADSGRYIVSFTATNAGGQDRETCIITVDSPDPDPDL